MSIRPLDLQVNMNSTLNLSQQQGGRVAAEVAQQKAIDKSAFDDGKLSRETVTPPEETESSRVDLDNESKEQQSNKKEKDDASKDKKPIEEKTTTDISEDKLQNHHISFLA